MAAPTPWMNEDPSAYKRRMEMAGLLAGQPGQPGQFGIQGAPDVPGNPAYDQLAQNEFTQQNALGQDLSRQIGDYYKNQYQPAAAGLQNQLGQYATQNKSDIQGFGTQYGQDAGNYRNQLAQNLLGFGQQQFQQASPAILEDLNRRGMLSSPTEVANAQAQALKEINLANQPTLMNFDTNTFNQQQNINRDALNAGMAGRDPELAKQLFGQGQDIQQQGLSALLGGQQAGVEGSLDLQRQKLGAELQRQSQDAEMRLAENLAKKEGRNQLTNSLIGAGGGILGGMLAGGGGGGGILGGLLGGGGGGGGLGGLIGGGGGAGTAGIGGVTSAGGGMGGILAPAAGIAGGFAAGTGLGQLAGNSIFKSKKAEKRARTGATVGSGIGAAAGSAFGPVGSLVGGTLGGLSGQLYGGLTASHAASQVSEQAKNLISKPVETIANAPKAVVKEASKAIKKVFCFHAYTPIEMADGTRKDIVEVLLGDETKGGTVESIRQSMTPEGTLFEYKGVIVTGSHAVKEGDLWLRVADSRFSIPYNGDRVVYSLCTTGHRVYVKNIEFADEHETDDYENLTMQQSLQALNEKAFEKVA